MRWAMVLLLVACTKSSSPSSPPPPDAAPPRPEGKADLDGDGAADCWQTKDRVLVVQPGCTGTSHEIDLGPMAVVLPKELDTPVWARALAGVIVGDANVGCEAKVQGCLPPHPALRAWLDRRTLPIPATDIRDRYAPIWLDGAPALPPPQAVLLDRKATRRDIQYDWTHDEPLPAEAAFILWRPGTGDLASITSCDAWEVRGTSSGTVVVDKRSKKWSWVEIGDARPDWPDGPAWRCAGSAIVRRGGMGEDSDTAHFVDPRTGRSIDEDLGWGNASELTLADDEVIGPRRKTIAQVRAELAMPDDEAAAAGGPCELTAAPLLAMPGGSSCSSKGTADIDGKEPLDCWTIERYGTRAGGTVSWEESVDLGCGGATRYGLRLVMNDVVSFANFETDTPVPRAATLWLAHRAVGDAVGCIPARKDCPAPDAALESLWTRFAAPWDDHPIWRSGTPAMWGPSALIADHDFHGYKGGALWVMRPVDWTIAKASGCDRWDLWLGDSGAAAVDRKHGTWTWLFLAGPKMRPYTTSSVAKSASCDDRHITIEHDDGTKTVFDAKGDAI